MKIFSTILFTICILNFSHAQVRKNVFFEQNALVNKFHTIDELENMKKGELIKLYGDRVREITIVIPYLALTNEAGVTLSDIGIKEDSDHLKSLDKHHISAQEAFSSTNNLISEFIPYADTEKIVWAILYFEEVIKKIRIGANGNF